ncbi:hypothetical protein PENSOL_c038G02133 [Penicillium solitum]|uniref:BAG domain-containing protein n=1 Tax=Penicillium solitum TaxID=60172 RepID=A0A1V6QTZ7_9EURO|nr:uncharacterized protein PENSOL_c038G02133 [Penicillium solitum]OQD92698.1 hypothetical protein PENSOL_c038G02133 [Penicillium solitum]
MMTDPKGPKTTVQRRSIKRNQGQDTSDTLLSKWTREAVDSNYDPFGQSTSSIEETVLEDISERKENATQDASLITEPNFDEQAASPAKPVENHVHPVVTTTTSPSMRTSMTNISFAVVQCLKDLSRLVSEDLSSFASEVPPALWKDELGRLRVWAANIGAHQTGQSSLDYRLRDASHIKEQTLRVLRRLQRTTEDINDILHHSPGDDDFSDLSGDEDDDEHQTEMQSIYHALRDTINNLFQMSMLIRQPAQHDRLLGTKRSDAVFYEQFDLRYVSDKYPQAGEDISKRLGLAISQRRAVMQYRERHRTKLGQGLNQVIEDQTDGQSTKLSDTVATEFVEVSPALERHVGRHLEELSLFALPRSEEDDDERAISSGEDSDKSYDPVDEGRCPQCDLVFTDLRAHAMTHNETERPEKCPIVTCDYHAKGFARRYDRNRHLLTHYKGVMVCHFCPGAGTPEEKSFTRADVFKRHLVTVHGVKQLQPNQLDQSPTSSVKTDMDHTGNSTANCSICNEPFEDPQDFYKHIDNCRKVIVNNMRLSEVSEDEETVDDRGYSSSSVRSQNEEKPYPRKGKTRVPRHVVHIHAIMDLGYPFKEEEDVIIIQRPLSKAQIDEFLTISREFKKAWPVGASQSTKENKLSGQVDLEMHESEIGPDDAHNFGPGSSKDLSQINEDVVAYNPDSFWNRQWDHPDENEPHENEPKIKVNQRDKEARYSSPLPPKPPSPPGSPSGIPSPPPNLKLLHTPMEQMTALAGWFERELIPICDEFIAHPSADPKKREYTHRKLSDIILAQVMLKVDGIDSGGDGAARCARRALIKQVRHVLKGLDSIAGV